jgi:hypothetical protein
VSQGVWRRRAVAVKRIPLINKQALAAFSTESALLSEIDHPAMCEFYGAIIEPGNVAMVLGRNLSNLNLQIFDL